MRGGAIGQNGIYYLRASLKYLTKGEYMKDINYLNCETPKSEI